MRALPPFSLLLPVYAGDHPRFLQRAFTSAVAEQTLPPREAVLVQDGPVSDELRAVIDSVKRDSPVPVVHVELPENKGLADALTQGLAACSFEIVARMDADDISEPNRFETQLALIDAGYELVGSGMHEFSELEDGTEELGRFRIPPTQPADIAKYSRFHDPFNHPTVVYSKAAVDRAGGYTPLGLMEDYWLFARMIATGVSTINSPEPLVRYRISSGAYSRRGGLQLLSSEWELQRAFRRTRFTSRTQFVRNVAMRGGYRLVPEPIRKLAYRAIILRRRKR